MANPITPGYALLQFDYSMGYLWVSATNIINKGILEADTDCEISLNGTNMNLSRGWVWIDPVGPNSLSGNTPTNFTPDTAIYDMYWAQTNMTFNCTNISYPLPGPPMWGMAISSPYFNATGPCGVNYYGLEINTGDIIPPLIDYVSNAFYAMLTVTNDHGFHIVSASGHECLPANGCGYHRRSQYNPREPLPAQYRPFESL